MAGFSLIQHATRDGCVITFTGDIDLRSVSQVQRTLLKDLSDQPSALICDLAGVDTLDSVCATVFSTVANHPASRWPDTGFLLCGAQPPVADILARLQVPHFLHMYASVQEAVDAAMARPPFRATSCGWLRLAQGSDGRDMAVSLGVLAVAGSTRWPGGAAASRRR